MLRFNRVTSAAVNLRIRFLQQLASRSAGTSAAAVTHENQPKFIPSVEQLHSKYKEELQNNKLSNIFEVIERIEWGGDSISGKIWQRASTLLSDAHTNVAVLTDRQLAQVIYAFGNRCDGVPKQKKRDQLAAALKAIEQRGVKLGPLSRTAVFTAKVDNGENPSVVGELEAWEAAGDAPTAEILQQFARSYALEGNVQGVIDIMTHMKTSQMPVDENVAGALVYAMVLKGQLPQAEAVAKKFSGAFNEVALQSAIIDGLIKAGELDEAVNKATKLASSAKIHQSGENNRHLLRVVCNLIENGVFDAFHKLAAYLSTSANGSTLSEKGNNGYVFLRARSARSEGKLAAALEIYSIVHPNFRSETFEQRSMDSFMEYLRSRQHDIAEIINLLDKLCSSTNIRSLNTFLLQAAMGTPNWQNVFENLKKDLPEVLTAKPELKRDLCKAIIPELSNKNVTDDRRAQILADLATVLFTKTEGDGEIDDISKVIYVAAGRDVPHIISALKIITEDRVKREMATSVVQQILNAKEDALKMEKLEKLLNSDAVESINISRIHALLKQRLKAKTEPNNHHLQLLAKLVGLAYSASNQRMAENFASKVLVSILTDSNISTSRLNKFVEALEQEPKARLSRDEVLETKNKMAELKLEDRVELLDRLKAQGQTYARWMASSVPSLEDELTNLEAYEKTNPSVIHKLQEVILKKLIQEKEVDFILCERTLRKIYEYTPGENGKGFARLKKQAVVLWEKAFLASLQRGRQEVAQQLWKIKTSFSPEAAISYIALEFVRDNVQQADEACAEFISTAQSVTAGSLELASKIVADYDASKVDALAKYLKDKLQLKNNMSRRIVSQIRRKQLKEMLEKEQVENAFQLAVEETSATGMAFGQHELFKASFDRKDTELTEKVYKMVMNAHDKNNAILDLAFAMLEHGITKHGENLLQTNELSISPKKLEYFVNRCVQMQRPDMLKSILFSLNNNKNVALSDLNRLLIQLIKIYYTNNSTAELQELESKLKEVSYPMDQHIQKIFENRKND